MNVRSSAKCAVRAAALALAFSWCGAASAEEAGSPAPGFAHSLARQLKLTSEPVHSADFVEKSRPPESAMRFVPTGGPRPEPGGPALMTADQIHAKEAELDALLARHNAAGHRAPLKVAVNSAAGRPFVKKQKARVNCLVTCRIDPSKPPT